MPHPIRLGQVPNPTRLKLHALRRRMIGASAPRYGYDGINSDALLIYKNTGATVPQFVCGYDDGLYAWSAADWALFNGNSGPATSTVTITVTASANEGDVLDVENGDATPSQTEAWISARKSTGYWRPTIYCSASVVPSVRAGTGKWILNQDYDLWVADWTGNPHQVFSNGTPCAVTQYASGSWADYDVAYDSGWPHRAVPAPPAPPPAPTPPPAPVPAPASSTAPVVSGMPVSGALQVIAEAGWVVNSTTLPGLEGVRTAAEVEATAYPNAIVAGYTAHVSGSAGQYNADSYDLVIRLTTDPVPTQNQWNFCYKCKGLFYGPEAATSVCPAGTVHAVAGSYDYLLNWSAQ